MTTSADQRPKDLRGEAPFSWRRWLIATLLMIVVLTVYLYGIIVISRLSLWAEAIIGIGFPLLIVAGAWFALDAPRINQLMLFESSYNAIAVVVQLSLLVGLFWLNHAGSWAFALFFLAQVGGFVAWQFKEKAYHGFAQSLVLGTLIFIWWFSTLEPSVVDADGRLLMWGRDAPLAVRIAYVIWVTTVLFNDVNDFYWRNAVAHLISVALSLWSGEFFHARLLTAAHIFCLERMGYWFFALPEGPGMVFGTPSAAIRGRYMTHVRPVLGWVTSVSMLILLVSTALFGLDLKGLF